MMRLVKDSKAELQALEDRLIGSAPIAKPVSIKAVFCCYGSRPKVLDRIFMGNWNIEVLGW